MNSDNHGKSSKTYKITEKEYANSKRDRERLLEIKGLIEKIHRITRQIKPVKSNAYLEIDANLVNKVVKLQESGMSLRQISKKLGKSQSWARQVVNRKLDK